MTQTQKHSPRVTRQPKRGRDRHEGLPTWEEGLHNPDEVEKVFARAKKRLEKIRSELKSEHPDATLIMIDAETGAVTLGQAGDDEVAVAKRHYSDPKHSPRTACLFRL